MSESNVVDILAKLSDADLEKALSALPSDRARKVREKLQGRERQERAQASAQAEGQNARFVAAVREMLAIAKTVQGMDRRLTAEIHICAANGGKARVTRIAEATEAEKAPLWLTLDDLEGSEDAPPTNLGKRPYSANPKKGSGDVPTPDQV